MNILIILYALYRVYFLKSPLVIDFTNIPIDESYLTIKISIAIIVAAFIMSAIYCLLAYYLTFCVASFIYIIFDGQNNTTLLMLFRIQDYIIYKYYLNYDIQFLFLIEVTKICNVSY